MVDDETEIYDMFRHLPSLSYLWINRAFSCLLCCFETHLKQIAKVMRWWLMRDGCFSISIFSILIYHLMISHLSSHDLPSPFLILSSSRQLLIILDFYFMRKEELSSWSCEKEMLIWSSYSLLLTIFILTHILPSHISIALDFFFSVSLSLESSSG